MISLLLQLDKKFPNKSRIKSWLGKSLSNQVIHRNEEGWTYLKEAIELFKKENNHDQIEGHIYFYFYNLLNNERFDLMQIELAKYETYINKKPKYHRFLARYYETLNKPTEEIIAEYKIAESISATKEEKVKSIESYLDYLEKVDSIEFELKIKELKLLRDELYKEIDDEKSKTNRMN